MIAQHSKIRKISVCKKPVLSIVFIFCLSTVMLFSQNLPPDGFVFIKGGYYHRQVYDSITNLTKTYPSQLIPDFYLSATEVSVKDFQAYSKATNQPMPPAPDWGWDDQNLPIVNVTYQDAVDYCAWLSNLYDVPFQLPSWDEWEYAAREGDFDPRQTDEINTEQVIYAANSYEKPMCVSCMQSNALGIYAGLGNVWEWVTKSTFYTVDSLFNIEEIRQETFWAGGSFFEDATKVKPNSLMSIPENTRRQDVGFRVMINAVEFHKAVLLKKIQQLLDQIFGEKKAIANHAGIFIEDTEFLWENILGDTALSYDVETSEVFFCCVLAIPSDNEETMEYLSVGFEVPKEKGDYVFDLMHLLNVETENLSLLKNAN
jgi:formylglycine-generating enzyme required for sulfatase activity